MNSITFLQERTFATLVILLLCQCLQAFKLPIDLRRSIATQDAKTQLQGGSGEILSAGRVLMFPEKSEDKEDTDYPVQLSFRNQDETSGAQSTNDDNAGLERFYKYSIKNQPSADEAIVFPKEAVENINVQRVLEIGEGSAHGSEGKSVANTEPEIAFEDLEKNSKNTSDLVQPLETLAHMVRQLLFRQPVTETPRRIITTESAVQTYDTSSELDVREQSLYSGPKLRTQSSAGDCPEGMKRTRNGSCQKPSRRLIS